MRSIRLYGMPFVAVLFLAGRAMAADLGTYEPLPPITEPGGFEARWEVNVAPYLWATSVTGTTRFGDLPVTDVDASFSDILENLDFAYMAVVEARRGRFGIFNDLIYADISAGGSATGPAGGVWTANLGNQMFIGTLGAEYRVVEAGKTSVDLMAGARLYYVSLDAKVTFSGVGGFPPVGAQRSFDNTWVDPMIGAKGRLQGASPWYLTGWAMVGGFGVSSDFAWDVFGGIGYEVSDRWSVVGGYRGLGVDYESSDLKFDIIMHGPIFGAVFHF